MFTSMRSRRMPALLTSTWRSPKVSTAVLTNLWAPSHDDTSSPLATASPPISRILSTTSPAGPAEDPVPSGSAPRSLTTTLAPCSASITACSRPMPRPPPVTMQIRPSHMVPISVLLRSGPPSPPAGRTIAAGISRRPTPTARPEAAHHGWATTAAWLNGKRLPALEVGRALLQERRHALLEVAAAEERQQLEEHVVDVVGERLVEPGAHHPLARPDGKRRVGRDLSRQR